MYTADDLETWFSHQPLWRLSGDVLTLLATDATPAATLPLTDLAIVHPDFPHAMVELANYQYRHRMGNTVDEFSGALLHSQVHFYRHPPRLLSLQSRIWHVRELLEVCLRDDAVDLAFNGYVTTSVASDNGTRSQLEFVWGSTKRYAGVYLSWMDEHYPGWRERYDVGVALVDSPVALARLVENVSSASAAVSLPADMAVAEVPLV